MQLCVVDSCCRYKAPLEDTSETLGEDEYVRRDRDGHIIYLAMDKWCIKSVTLEPNWINRYPYQNTWTWTWSLTQIEQYDPSRLEQKHRNVFLYKWSQADLNFQLQEYAI